MARHLDLKDQIFGKLIVVEREYDPKYKKPRTRVWYCLCECGGFTRASTVQLTKGHIKHCGCMPKVARPRTNLTGQKFGDLVVLYPTETIGKKTTWMSQCSCGKYRKVQLSCLRQGYAKSCGCKQKAYSKKSKYVYETVDEVCRI